MSKIQFTSKLWEDFLNMAVDAAGASGWKWFEKNYELTEYTFKELLMENQEKAEKYDSLGDIIKQVNDLLNENKQLNTKFDLALFQNRHFKEKLEKIKQANSNYDEDSALNQTIDKILEEE